MLGPQARPSFKSILYLVYDELRRTARSQWSSQKPNQTLRERVNDLLAFEDEEQSFLSEEQLAPRNLPEQRLIGTQGCDLPSV